MNNYNSIGGFNVDKNYNENINNEKKEKAILVWECNGVKKWFLKL